jgi:predicted nucleotidyltransferase
MIRAGLRRLLARSGGGALRPLYVGGYRLVARAVAAYLRRSNGAASVYATSSLATGELVPGVSDLDLAVVVPRDRSPGAARQALESRRDRLWRLVPFLAPYVWVAVYEEEELARAQTVSLAQTASGSDGQTLFFGRSPLADDLTLSSRPGLPGRVHTWKLLSGADLRGAPRPRSRDEDRLAAWLELQAWWLWAVQACLDPSTPGRSSLCVKLVAEPCRILLWLQHREELQSRRAVLERARELLPSEHEAIAEALALQGQLSRSPAPPLERCLPALLRLTARVASLLADELEPLGSTEVRLDWGGEDELARDAQTRDRLRALAGEELRLLPLADWRALAGPTLPDECFAPVAGDPGDPAVVAAAARAGSPVAYAGLRAGDVLVLPPSDVYWLGKHRCVHFPASDPVSFALLEGAEVARFPLHVGWSIADVTARAVAEHRAYLDVQLAEPGWDVEKLGVVLNAARAGLLAESLAAGEPFLSATVAATARALGERVPAARGVAEEAAAAYRRHRLEGGPPLDSLVSELARVVSSLPAFASADPGGRKLLPRHEERASAR